MTASDFKEGIAHYYVNPLLGVIVFSKLKHRAHREIIIFQNVNRISVTPLCVLNYVFSFSFFTVYYKKLISSLTRYPAVY